MRLMEIRSKDKYRSMKKELQLIPDQLPHLSSGGRGEGRGDTITLSAFQQKCIQSILREGEHIRRW